MYIVCACNSEMSKSEMEVKYFIYMLNVEKKTSPIKLSSLKKIIKTFEIRLSTFFLFLYNNIGMVVNMYKKEVKNSDTSARERNRNCWSGMRKILKNLLVCFFSRMAAAKKKGRKFIFFIFFSFFSLFHHSYNTQQQR